MADIHAYFPMGRREDHSFALTISHPNFLTCRLIDENQVRYDTYENTFSNHISDLKGKGITPIKYCVYNYDENNVSYGIVTDSYREFTSSMIQFVIYLHTRGISLDMSGLSLERNFVIKDYMLKFCCVTFREATSETKANDFRLIYDVLTSEIFHGEEKNLPYDMDDLLTLISPAAYEEKNEQLISNHLAIMHSTMRICFCRNIWERRTFLSDEQVKMYDEVVENIGSFKGWTKHFKNATKYSFLEKCFYQGFPSGEHATDEEIRSVYNDMSRSKSEVNFSFIKFCRNMTAHLPEMFEKRQRKPKEHGTDEAIDAMLMQYFDKTVTKIQHELHKKNLLEIFCGCSFRS